MAHPRSPAAIAFPVRILFSLLWFVGGCAGVAVTRPGQLDLEPLQRLSAADFPGAAAVMSGFAPDDEDRGLRVGDAVLFGVQIRNGDELQRLMLHLEVVEREVEVRIDGVPQIGRRVQTVTIESSKQGVFESQRTYRLHPAEFALRRFDAEGELLQDSRAALFEEALLVGWWPHTVGTDERSLIDDDMATALTFTVQRLANDDPTLRALLTEMVDLPGLFSVLFSFGVNVTLQWTEDGPRDCDLQGPAAGHPARVVPLGILINGEPALWTEMVVTPPRGALIACGGLLGVVATHPRDPGRVVAVRLLATRRGPTK